jgi:hypothetical protein
LEEVLDIGRVDIDGRAREAAAGAVPENETERLRCAADLGLDTDMPSDPRAFQQWLVEAIEDSESLDVGYVCLPRR